MIHINLDGSANNFTRAITTLLIAQKIESLGYADNPYEMNCGVSRCKYVATKMALLKPEGEDKK